MAKDLISFPGLSRVGVIGNNYDDVNATVEVIINQNNVLPRQVVIAQLPLTYYSNSGAFAGGYPEPGTIVLISQATGGSWYISTFLSKDTNSMLSSSIDKIPVLSRDTYVIQSSENVKILLNKNNGITIGSDSASIQVDSIRKIYSSSFDTKLSYTEASREVSGIIKRDISPNSNIVDSIRNKSISIDDSLYEVSLDPTLSQSYTNNKSSIRNPPFVEKREIVYEFAESFEVLDNLKEQSYYLSNIQSDTSKISNRREKRTDTLSLSLVYPNNLMETTKGTVVDIYGNILDINRSVIQIGKSDSLSLNKIKDNINNINTNVYKNIKQQSRKGIAFHFELNVKKSVEIPDVTIQTDYARDRSRFFVDVDKEGLFKVNVPATSETGNIPLLTRYENYSTVTPNQTSLDPNDVTFNTDYQDILIESFANNNGTISIIDESGSLASPKNRFNTINHIGHGTVFHDINALIKSNTDAAMSSTSSIEYIQTTAYGQGLIKSIGTPVSKSIIIGGESANAGGRSGSLNLDGSIDINIGANTVDRQSMWLDMAGGAAMHFGRDKNNISIGASLDGDFIVEIGGEAVSNDSRFKSLKNGHRAGALDIRVYNDNTNELTLVRIDKNGVQLSTPGKMTFYSNQNMMFRSAADIDIEAENIRFNGRPVKRSPNSL